VAEPFFGGRIERGQSGLQKRTSNFQAREFDTMVDELEETESSPQDERRQQRRSRLIVDVFFNGEDATGVASTKDISLGGLYMNTQTVVPEGSVLLLRIPLGDEQIVVNAEVVYSNPGRGIGVQFQGLAEKDRALMERELPPL
jgi:hypothetical protein